MSQDGLALHLERCLKQRLKQHLKQRLKQLSSFGLALRF